MALNRDLTLTTGIPLALGSVLGSGVLFLPSLTYAISGAHTLWVWILITLLCIPLVYIFIDMVKAVPNESGIEGFVSLGLGKKIGAAIPLIFLGTVSIGMPAAALIVGDYVKNFLNGGHTIQIITAFLIVAIGIYTNLFGVRISSSIQLLISALVLLVALSLILFVPSLKFDHTVLSFSFHHTQSIMQGMIVAFWAYAGFENLTFMAGEFKNPARDIKLSMLIALFLCGILYFFLADACISNISKQTINPFIGLYQLAEVMNKKLFFTALITGFAFLTVTLNFNSWILGISRLIYSSAIQKKFFGYFAQLNKQLIPVRAVWLLGAIFSISLIVAIFFPNLLNVLLIVVSTNFVFLYLLCLISFSVFKKNGFLRTLSIILILLLTSMLLSSKWILLYPLFLLMTGILWSSASDKRLNKINISRDVE